jgi:hypothetical protein
MSAQSLNGERRNHKLGLILHLFVEGMKLLFRHPTRQLTSSAKAKEVYRPPLSGGFFVVINSKKAA